MLELKVCFCPLKCKEVQVGIHDIGSFCQYLMCQYLTTHLADNQYRLYTEMYIFSPTPNCRDHQVSSVVNLHTVSFCIL